MEEDGWAFSSSFQTLSDFSILGLIVGEDLKNNLFPISGILKIFSTLEYIFLGSSKYSQVV